MILTDDQIARYRDEGYLIFPGLLSDAEMAIVQADVPVLQSDKRGHPDANVLTLKGAIRTSYSPGLDSPAFDTIFRLPRLCGPARQLLGGDVYLYQSRLNAKPRGDQGAAWQWHQDFPSWYHDGVPEPSMLTALVMISDCTEENSPLQLIPRVQKNGIMKYFYDTESTGYALNSLPSEDVETLAAESPPVTLTGVAGTVVFFGCLVPHGSGANPGDAPRNLMFYVYNRDDNRCTGAQERRPQRSKYLLNLDPVKLSPDADDAILRLA